MSESSVAENRLYLTPSKNTEWARSDSGGIAPEGAGLHIMF